jgi:hypothetical protein
MSNGHDGGAPGSSEPTARDLRAARRRGHEEEKQRRGSSGGQGKDKKGKGGGDQGRADNDRSRH